MAYILTRNAPSAEAEPLHGIRCLHFKRAENLKIYLYDGRSSVVQLLQGGTVSQSYSYNAYGYINTDEYGIQAPFYGYNDEQHDPSTGLQYLRARYYAPQNGSFVTQDSFAGLLTDALSQNSYTYAQNNPVTFADPSGHSIWGSIKNGVTNAVNAVTSTVTSAYNAAKNTVTSAYNAVKNTVTNAYNAVKNTVTNAYNAIKNTVTGAYNAAKNTVTSAVNTVSTAASSAVTSVKNAYTSIASSPAANAVSNISSQPYTTILKAVGLTNVFTLPLQLMAASSELTKLYHGCDPSSPYYTAQNDSNSSMSQYAQLLLDAFGKSSLGRDLAFLQGATTAFVDDIASVGNDFLSLFKGKSDAQLGGLNDLNDSFNIGRSSTYTPLFGNQNEMAAGRIAGHVFTMLLGGVETLGGLVCAGVIEGGGLVLAPVTGGTSAAAATPAGILVGTVSVGQGLVIAKEGIAGLFGDPNILFSWGSQSSSASDSHALRENLKNEGVEEPIYENAAHHIVAGNSPLAAEARAILDKFGIHINSFENGVFLPTEHGVSNACYHPSLHTRTYYAQVNELLRNATSYDEDITILAQIRGQLLNGTFPH